MTYEIVAGSSGGTLTATNLKPNFAYQLKLNGIAGTPSNEAIGLAGRWLQEEWNGTQWANGQNLNNKGDGSSPNPNDVLYFARRDVADPTSPTGLRYKFTGYLVFDYFIAGENGVANFSFETASSYHVLWKTTQRTRTASDGPIKTATFDPDPALSPAYDTDYGDATISIFEEWERLPVGGIFPNIGDDFEAQLILTEESFHGSGGQYAGGWAAAMSADTPPFPYPETGVVSGVTNDAWTTVTLDHEYDFMVVVCNPNYDKNTPPLVVRVQNASANQFEVRVDRVDGLTGLVAAIDVHYLVVEEGVYQEATRSVKMEAVKFISTRTDRYGSWVGESRTYANPTQIRQWSGR